MFFSIHLVIFLSWVTMEVMVILLLERFHQAETIWAAHIFGYLATIGLLGGTAYALLGRARKSETHFKHTHATDWMFLILIAGAAATGIAQHASYRWLGLDSVANIAYLIHMMFVVPLLAVQIPFSKLSHLAYRPLAMYLAAVHADALARRQAGAAQTEPEMLAA